jgi:signal transduction histidine kinase/CheY-like chemotaxis protein/HPt (histidine-containing phosphotransfer) domain-containing protein
MPERTAVIKPSAFRESGRESSMAEPAVHSRREQLIHLGTLLAAMALLAAPFAWLTQPPVRAFKGGGDLHAALEMVGALFGLVTGFALVLRFHALANRFHLFIGLAFFVNGMQDFVHGLLCFRDLFGIDEAYRLQFIPPSYVTGQLLMGATLLLALVVPDWLGKSASQIRETVRISLIVLAMTLLAVLVPLAAEPGWLTRPQVVPTVTNAFSTCVLGLALAAYARRYWRDREILTWWIALSLAANFIGQGMMLFSHQTFDAWFHVAHGYKVLGYLVPLAGFFIYQTRILLERERTQRELIAARESALSATRAKSEFLANMSHEIRTPMNGILGMMHQVLKTELTPSQRDDLLDAYRSAENLLGLLNDILDFSKMEVGKLELHPEPFDLRACVSEAVSVVAPLARQRGLEIACTIDNSVPTKVIGDPGRLRQIIVNLVGNAVKFTEHGGIGVNVAPVNVGDDDIVIRFGVGDTGIGIPAEKQSAIFASFSQADGSISRRYGGTGLGLAIAAQLVRLMDGEIHLQSKPGEGSLFEFTARLHGCDQAINSTPAADRSPADLGSLQVAQPVRILIVEDNEINQKVAIRMLTALGCVVAVESEGTAALSRLQRQAFELLLLDVHLPGMSGLEVAAAVRQAEGGTDRHLPIVALTARAMKGDRELCLAAGMDDYLAKPIQESELIRVLGRYFKLRTSGESDDTRAEPARPVPARRPDPQSEVAVFDRSAALSQVKGRLDVLAELSNLFLRQARELLADMRAAWERGDCAALQQKAHRLAGSAANLHADRTSHAAKRVESLARNDRPLELPTALEHLAHEVDAVCAVLETPGPRDATKSVAAN